MVLTKNFIRSLDVENGEGAGSEKKDFGIGVRRDRDRVGGVVVISAGFPFVAVAFGSAVDIFPWRKNVEELKENEQFGDIV